MAAFILAALVTGVAPHGAHDCTTFSASVACFKAALITDDVNVAHDFTGARRARAALATAAISAARSYDFGWLA